MHRCAVELPHHDWQRLELQSTKELVNKLFMKSLFHQVFEGNMGLKHFKMNAIARMQAEKHTGYDLRPSKLMMID